MPRRVEDIVPGDRRSVRDIPGDSKPEKTKPAHTMPHDIRRESAHSKKTDSKPKSDEIEVPIHHVPIAPPPLVTMPSSREDGKRRGGGRMFTAVVIVVIVLGCIGYAGSIYFSRAVFTIVPRVMPVTVNSAYIATSQPQSNSLTYELASVTSIASTTVPASDGALIEAKAQGQAIFYNNYSTQPWRLIAGTRLTNDAGNVYRLSSSIAIPGYTKSASGSIVPGTVSAAIAADQAGQEYNLARDSSMGSMAIVAYQNTSKFGSIYAKISSDIRGGFAGTKKIVSPAAFSSTTEALKSSLTAILSARIKNAVPAGYVVYDRGFIPVFGTPDVGGGEPHTAVVSLKGTVYAVLLKRNDLVIKLAGDSAVRSFGGLAFDAPGLENLSFSINNLKDFSPAKKNALSLQIKGNMKLVGSIPVDQLKAKFAGISLAETKSIMQALSPVIDLEKSSGQVVPPWSKIPSNPDKISIIVQE